MTTTDIGATVTLVDLAAALGVVEVAPSLDAAGVAVVADWAGRPSITVTDAERFVREWRERAEAHSAQERRLNAAAEAFMSERVEVVRDAYRKAVGDRAETPSVRAKASRASYKARRSFERKCPVELHGRVGPTLLREDDRPGGMVNAPEVAWPAPPVHIGYDDPDVTT